MYLVWNVTREFDRTINSATFSESYRSKAVQIKKKQGLSIKFSWTFITFSLKFARQCNGEVCFRRIFVIFGNFRHASMAEVTFFNCCSNSHRDYRWPASTHFTVRRPGLIYSAIFVAVLLSSSPLFCISSRCLPSDDFRTMFESRKPKYCDVAIVKWQNLTWKMGR